MPVAQYDFIAHDLSILSNMDNNAKKVDVIDWLIDLLLG